MERRRSEGSGDRVGEKVRQRQVRRRQILEAAAIIFSQKGYEATSIQEIAEAAGLLKGNLYYYIESKEDMLFSIINEAHEGALRSLEIVRKSRGNALEKIDVLVETALLYFMENRVKTTVFLRDFRSLSEDKQEIIVGERDQYTQELRALILKGQRSGVVSPRINPKLISMGIMGMFNSLTQWYDPNGPCSQEEIAAEFTRFVLNGLALKAASGELY